MYLTLRSLYFAIQSNFWFVPALITIGSLIAAPLSLQADFHVDGDALTRFLPGPAITQEGARMVLSTVAGSMMTVASLVFSMTLLALSLVSQQLGPRVLQFFMEDVTTKIVLGVFIGTFLFSLIVLGTIGTGANGGFVPRFSVFVAGFLAILAFVLMIFFVHHISTQIQADIIVARLGQQFSQAAHSLLDDNNDNVSTISESQFDELAASLKKSEHAVTLDQSGYVGSIDEPACVAVAREHDLTVRFVCRPGHFVLAGEPILHVAGQDTIDEDVLEKLKKFFSIQPRRTREQHVEFEMNALVEVALRALSAGINDPYTAMACIDRLAEGITLFLTHGPELRVLKDKDGVVRVLLHPQGFDHYLNTAFHPIRHAANQNPQVLLNLLAMLRDLASLSKTQFQRDAINQHVDAIEQSCAVHLGVEHDVKLLNGEIRRTRLALSGS